MIWGTKVRCSKCYLDRKGNIVLDSDVRKAAKAVNRTIDLSGDDNNDDDDADEDDDNVCAICLEEPKTHAFLHTASGAAHRAGCYTCTKTLMDQGMTCPVCRQTIDAVVKGFG